MVHGLCLVRFAFNWRTCLVLSSSVVLALGFHDVKKWRKEMPYTVVGKAENAHRGPQWISPLIPLVTLSIYHVSSGIEIHEPNLSCQSSFSIFPPGCRMNLIRCNSSKVVVGVCLDGVSEVIVLLALPTTSWVMLLAASVTQNYPSVSLH